MIMTSRSKFVIQCGSTVWQQSVVNVILVSQKPLEQIIVRDVSEFGCCQDIRTAQSRAHTPVDDCLHSLPISCRSKTPPGVGCIRQFGDDNTPENCLYRLVAHAMGTQGSNCVNRLCTRADDVLYVSTDRQFIKLLCKVNY